MINRFNRRKKSNCNSRKRIPKNTNNIKYLALSPFIPGNKRLLNKESDHNPETADTSRSEKDDTSYTGRCDSIAKVKDTKNTNDDEDSSKHQDGNERVDNPETSDTLRDESVISTTK